MDGGKIRAGGKFIRFARYALLSGAAFLVLAVAADKAFYLYSRFRHASLVAHWDSLARDYPSGSFSQSDIRRIFGAPDISKAQEWTYRCQDFSQSRHGFPFCEILLSGSADHFMVYEVHFRFRESGGIAASGTEWHTGFLFEAARTTD